MTTAEEIRRTISVPAVLEILGLDPPERIPGLIQCPVHDDDTPSLNIDETVWYCHACGQGGSCIDLVMFAGSTTFGQAMRFLEGSVDAFVEMPTVEQREKELLDLTREYEKPKGSQLSSWEGGSYMQWCEDKWPQWRSTGLGHKCDMARDILEFGWARLAQQQLWIPHYDSAGVVRGVKLRLMNLKPYGKKSAITGSYFSSRPYRVLERPFAPLAYLVEGETDCWTMSQHFLDDPNVVVYGMPSGVATWKPWFADELNRHAATIVCFDDDEAGRRGYLKVAKSLVYSTRQILPEGANDVTEAFAQGWRPRLGQ